MQNVDYAKREANRRHQKTRDGIQQWATYFVQHNITLDGEKNTFVSSPLTSSRNSLKANRVLGEHEDPVTSEARTADDFRTNGHGMGIPRR